MRYTQYRGLEKVKMELTLKFAYMNLKKLAIWKARTSLYFIKNLKKYLKIEKTAVNFLFLMTVCLQAEVRKFNFLTFS